METKWCPRHEDQGVVAHRWNSATTGLVWVTLACGCTLPLGKGGKPVLTLREARRG